MKRNERLRRAAIAQEMAEKLVGRTCWRCGRNEQTGVVDLRPIEEAPHRYTCLDYVGCMRHQFLTEYVIGADDV